MYQKKAFLSGERKEEINQNEIKRKREETLKTREEKLVYLLAGAALMARNLFKFDAATSSVSSACLL